MKKSVLIGIAVVAVGVGLWIGLRGNGDSATTEHTEEGSPSIGAEESVKSIKSEESVDRLQNFSEDKLSAAVKALLGLDGEEHDYNSLGNAIGKLSKDLSPDDVAALRDMLTWPNDKFPEGMRDIEINAIKNDVLDRLLRQNTLPEGIGLQLVEMASNPDNVAVWRDYCVQFMSPYYERASQERSLTTEGHGGDSFENSMSSSEAGKKVSKRCQKKVSVYTSVHIRKRCQCTHLYIYD